MFPIAAALVVSYAISSYVLLRRPHLLHAKKSFPFTACHISHRGGAGENIENTLEAFRWAQRNGTQMLELDCRLTKDGQVVVFHDSSVERCTEAFGELNSFDYRSLPLYRTKVSVHFEPGHTCDRSSASPQQIILLRDVFQQFPDLPINLDLKVNDDHLIRQVSDLIAEFKREKYTIWGGMGRSVTRKCKRANPNLLTYPPGEHILGYVLAYHIGLLPFLPIPYDCFELPLLPVFRSRGIVIGPYEDSWLVRSILGILDYFMTSPGFYRHLKLRGIPVFCWVANADADFQIAFDLGASGVMTDFPSRLRSFLDKNPGLVASQL